VRVSVYATRPGAMLFSTKSQQLLTNAAAATGNNDNSTRAFNTYVKLAFHLYQIDFGQIINLVFEFVNHQKTRNVKDKCRGTNYIDSGQIVNNCKFSFQICKS